MKSTTAASGALSVMTTGTSAMATLSVGSWATVEQHMFGPGPTLAREPDRYGWIIFAVLGTRPICLTVTFLAGGLITVDIMKMLESLVPLVINYKLRTENQI